MRSSLNQSSEVRKRIRIKSILSVVVFVLCFLVSFTLGKYSVTVPQVLEVFRCRITGAEFLGDPLIPDVVLKIRLPRIIVASIIGGSLAVSGAAYQGLFKNPMVSPDILGASTGAGFGASIAIIFSLSYVGVQFSAFAFGLIATGLAYGISRIVSRGKEMILTLVLSGMVVSALFSAFVTMIKYVADPLNKLPEITYWLMGGLASVRRNDVQLMVIPAVIGVVILFLMRWKLNVLSFGEEEASALGVNTSRVRFLTIIAATMLTAASVSIGGMIGWVGLIIPHLTRIIVGPNYKDLIPVSFLLGASFLLIVDDVSRTMFPMEIPLGILTAIIGAPFFVGLLFKRKKGWT